MKIEYQIKGVILNDDEVYQVHDYFERVILAEYMIELFDLSDEVALTLAGEVRQFILDKDYPELDAIHAVVTRYRKENGLS